jgi:hypothetical protein
MATKTTSRYKNKRTIVNDSDKYQSIRTAKGLKTLTQHQTFDLSGLQRLQSANLFTVTYRVQPFDKLFMISQKFYNSPEYGWLICATNTIANEMLITEGTLLIIYLPLEQVLGVINGSIR